VRPSTQDGFETLVHRHGWRGRGVAAPGRQPPSQGIMAARGVRCLLEKFVQIKSRNG
jgi:hypothetical protein